MASSQSGIIMFDESLLPASPKLRYKSVRYQLKRIITRFKRKYEKSGNIPGQYDNVWEQLSNLYERLIRLSRNNNGLEINLTSPRTLAEKIEWLKLNEHKDTFQEL